VVIFAQLKQLVLLVLDLRAHGYLLLREQVLQSSNVVFVLEHLLSGALAVVAANSVLLLDLVDFLCHRLQLSHQVLHLARELLENHFDGFGLRALVPHHEAPLLLKLSKLQIALLYSLFDLLLARLRMLKLKFFDTHWCQTLLPLKLR
jgi:hypothetical protein